MPNQKPICSCDRYSDPEIYGEMQYEARSLHKADSELTHEEKRERDGICPDDGEYCQECCDHEYDSSEGYMCINCDKEYPW